MSYLTVQEMVFKLHIALLSDHTYLELVCGQFYLQLHKSERHVHSPNYTQYAG